MNVERRLQHAARELRGVEIAVPPLGGHRPGRRPSRLHLAAAPVLIPLLFVAGALFAIGTTRPGVGLTTQSDITRAGVTASALPRSAVAVTVGSVGGPDVASTTGPSTPTNAVGAESSVDGPSGVEAPSVLVELQMIADLVDTLRSQPGPHPSSPTTPPGRPRDFVGPI